MKSRFALAVAIALAAAPVLPATATPTAGVQRYVETSFELRGKDGLRYVFDLAAMEAGAGQNLPSELRIDVRQCTNGGACKFLAKARVPLEDGSVHVAPDLSSGTLKATVGGLQFAASLTHVNVETDPMTVHNPGFTLYGLESGSGASPRADASTDATGTAGISRSSCAVEGLLYTYQGVDQKGEDVRDPRPSSLNLSSRVLAALRGGRCLNA